MKKVNVSHTVLAKTTAYFLLLLFTVVLTVSVVGMILMWAGEVYTKSSFEIKTEYFRSMHIRRGYDIAAAAGDPSRAEMIAQSSSAEYRIYDEAGNEVFKSIDFDFVDPLYSFTSAYSVTNNGEVYVLRTGIPFDHAPDDTQSEQTEQFRTDDPRNGSALVTVNSDTHYFVETRIDPSFPVSDGYKTVNNIINVVYALRYSIYFIALVSGICIILSFIFIMCSAGHRAGKEGLTPGYFYKVPFDLLTALFAFALLMSGCCIIELSYAWNLFELIVSCLLALTCILMFVGWCSSLAARIKMGRWYKNTIIYYILRLLFRFIKALFRGIISFFRAIPMVLRTVFFLIFTTVCAVFFLFCWEETSSPELFFIWLLVRIAWAVAVIYVAASLRRLQQGGNKLASGDLSYHTDTSHMLWDFKKHGENLNSIAEGAKLAVEEQLKGERLKTELLTNVSHDLKTPLTSIINYVDLLSRNPTPDESKEYLEILRKQSNRLKKLTEDLIEASKAATGNIDVSMSRHSANELLRQTLGEYEDRLEAAGLTPVLVLPEKELFVYADGSLMWRMLDNIMSNACKYAQSGTRLYAEASLDGSLVRFTFKNISKDPLNVPSEELLERFVRGNSDRGGEGSGLGLSIAKSLAELQDGTFTVSADGDLFKAEITLSSVNN